MKFTINSPTAKQACIAYIQNINPAEKPIMDVEIKAFKKDRTSPQNRYYWGIVLKMASEYTGYTCDELHELFKNSFLQGHEVVVGDKRVLVTPSTTKLSTVEFNDYIEDVCRYLSATLGLVVPQPNERL